MFIEAQAGGSGEDPRRNCGDDAVDRECHAGLFSFKKPVSLQIGVPRCRRGTGAALMSFPDGRSNAGFRLGRGVPHMTLTMKLMASAGLLALSTGLAAAAP